MLTAREQQELSEIKALQSQLLDELRRSLELTARIKRTYPGLRRDGLPEPPPVLAFVHIPKTAGGTVESIFTAAYSKRAIQKTGNYLQGMEGTARKLERAPGGWETWSAKGGRLAVGHVPLGVYLQHLPLPTHYMTFLREPVDRVLSHFHRHLLKRRDEVDRVTLTPWTPEEGGRRVRVPTLEAALVERRLPHIANLATRFLCGHPHPLGDLPASAVDDAKERLRDFAFVGIQERFEESLVLLRRFIGLERVPDYQDRHVSKDRPSVEDISAEQRALIEEYNQMDVELYRFGQDLFDECIAAADENFASEVAELRARPRQLAEAPRERRAAKAREAAPQ